jgi:hypothetical protein
VHDRRLSMADAGPTVRHARGQARPQNAGFRDPIVWPCPLLQQARAHECKTDDSGSSHPVSWLASLLEEAPASPHSPPHGFVLQKARAPF